MLGLAAKRLKVLAWQEALAVCLVLEVLEATWCLVWDSQWEERNISAGRSVTLGHIHSCLLEAFALFQSDNYSLRNPPVRRE